MSLLDVDGISIHFGGVQALAQVSLEVHRGEIVAGDLPAAPSGL